jgi:uncharacterized protein YhfF
MRTSKADRYWNQFVQSLPPGAERPERYYEAFHFGITKQDATEIAALVLQGTKTSTGALAWVYEAEGRAAPEAGDHSVVLDEKDNPVCIIETTESRVVSFEDVDEQFAYEGGEGDRTLPNWREGYWSYIVSECARINREPTVRTPLVCERFRVVYQELMQALPPGTSPHATGEY